VETGRARRVARDRGVAGTGGEKEAILTKRRAPASWVEFRDKKRLLQHNKLPRKMAEKRSGASRAEEEEPAELS